MLQIAYVSKSPFSGEKTKWDVLLINATVKISSEDKGCSSVAEHFLIICDFGFDFQDHKNRQDLQRAPSVLQERAQLISLGGKMVGHHRRLSTEGVDFKMSFLWFPVKFLY